MIENFININAYFDYQLFDQTNKQPITSEQFRGIFPLPW